MRTLLVTVMVLTVACAFAQEKSPRPAKDVLADAQKQAKAEKKVILLVFGASW